MQYQKRKKQGKGTKTILKAIMTGKFFQINVRHHTSEDSENKTKT